MYSVVYSAAAVGVGSALFRVEADCSGGLPGFEMVGLLSSEVKEARERVRVALSNCGYPLPALHITVNLSPADVRKEGAAFDLPIAIGLMVSMGSLKQTAVDDFIIIGELGLGGEVKAVRGILPIVRQCLKLGYTRFLVPKTNAGEAAVFSEATVYPVSHLSEAVKFFLADKGKREEIISVFHGSPGLKEEEKVPDFSDVIGQESALKACVVAAAGFHHLLMVGPPGTGKSMMARRIPSILPYLDREESLEVSGIYSIAGNLPEGKLMRIRPFVAPHHTTSAHALAGGGHVPRPGSITLAHRGVLFLDELPEFDRRCIESLRQPLEDKRVLIQRTGGNYVFPADFMLVSAMNPCPCGFFPDRNRCTCTAAQIQHYLSKISGPILDRIDLCATVNLVDITQCNMTEKRGGEEGGLSSEKLREMVLASRSMQEKRYKGSDYRFNSELKPGDVMTYCELGSEERAYMETIYRKLNLSMRGYHRILKCARTIADMDYGMQKSAEDGPIKKKHLAEAVAYRPAGYLGR